MKTALVMVGGRSARMRATAGAEHKALRPVVGVSLLERNLCRLLDYGFREIAVAVSAEEEALCRYLTRRGRALARARNCTLEPLLEQSPLGTIGIVRDFRTSNEPVVVVNGDNLTNLDLRALLARHRAVRAEMTVAVHQEPFRIPLGEVTVNDGQLVSYAEKPIHEVLISSGAYVVEPAAAARLGPGERCDVPRLVSRVADAGGKIAAYAHSSLWIDVNDASDLQRCEALVRDYPDAFECWESEPDCHVLDLVLRHDSHILVARSLRDDSVLCGLPSEDCGPEPSMADVMRLWRRCARDGDPVRITNWTLFDDLDVHSGALVRHHVFRVDVSNPEATAGSGENAWLRFSEAAQNVLPFDSTLERVLTRLDNGP